MRQLTLVLALSIASSLAAQESFNFSRDVGVAVTRTPGVTCISFPAPQPAPGTQVVLAHPSDSLAIVVATVLPPEHSECRSTDVALGDSLQAIAIVGGVRPQRGSFWFALRTGATTLTVANDTITGDLDRDGVRESLRVCASMEGLHLTIWSGSPLVGRRRWTRYVPLYYDVEPSCDERDFADPTTAGR